MKRDTEEEPIEQTFAELTAHLVEADGALHQRVELAQLLLRERDVRHFAGLALFTLLSIGARRGALAAVEDGDMIELDAMAGKLNLLVDEREIQRRLDAWKPAPPAYELGYRALWLDQVTQAPEGCDFRFNVDKGWRKQGVAEVDRTG